MFHFLYLTPTPTTETYTLSLHDALPISRLLRTVCFGVALFALALSACDQPTLQRGPTGTINLHGATTQVQSAALVEYPVPDRDGFPYDIVIGPDGNFWITGHFSPDDT